MSDLVRTDNGAKASSTNPGPFFEQNVLGMLEEVSSELEVFNESIAAQAKQHIHAKFATA